MAKRARAGASGAAQTTTGRRLVTADVPRGGKAFSTSVPMRETAEPTPAIKERRKRSS
jgi:hypothetical protein